MVLGKKQKLLFFVFYLEMEFFKQLNRFGIDFFIGQTVFGLVKKHKSVGFIKVFNQ